MTYIFSFWDYIVFQEGSDFFSLIPSLGWSSLYLLSSWIGSSFWNCDFKKIVGHMAIPLYIAKKAVIGYIQLLYTWLFAIYPYV